MGRKRGGGGGSFAKVVMEGWADGDGLWRVVFGVLGGYSIDCMEGGLVKKEGHRGGCQAERERVSCAYGVSLPRFGAPRGWCGGVASPIEHLPPMHRYP